MRRRCCDLLVHAGKKVLGLFNLVCFFAIETCGGRCSLPPFRKEKLDLDDTAFRGNEMEVVLDKTAAVVSGRKLEIE